jgi:hypothetical protein
MILMFDILSFGGFSGSWDPNKPPKLKKLKIHICSFGGFSGSWDPKKPPKLKS